METIKAVCSIFSLLIKYTDNKDKYEIEDLFTTLLPDFDWTEYYEWMNSDHTDIEEFYKEKKLVELRALAAECDKHEARVEAMLDDDSYCQTHNLVKDNWDNWQTEDDDRDEWDDIPF